MSNIWVEVVHNHLKPKEVVGEVSVVNDGRVEALQRTEDIFIRNAKHSDSDFIVEKC